MMAPGKALLRTLLERYGGAALVVEVGVGQRCDVARALAQESPRTRVVATDVDGAAVQAHARCRLVHTVHDDAAKPTLGLYAGAAALYALRPPAELVPVLEALADRIGADLVVAPLSEDASACRGAGWTRPEPRRFVFLRRGVRCGTAAARPQPWPGASAHPDAANPGARATPPAASTTTARSS